MQIAMQSSLALRITLLIIISKRCYIDCYETRSFDLYHFVEINRRPNKNAGN